MKASIKKGHTYRNAKKIGATTLVMALHLSLGTAQAAMVKLSEGTSNSYHPSLSSAYGAISGTGASILAQAGTFREDIDFSSGKAVKLSGGLDSSYSHLVGATMIAGDLTVSSGSLQVANIVLAPTTATPVRIIYLHHSTGGNIWEGGVPDVISSYNSSHGTDYLITERAYPDSPYPWENYPYDYWKLWVDTTGATGYLGQDTLDVLAGAYDVIVFKHCFPVSEIEADTGTPDITSSRKSIENYKLQYNALKARMRQFPTKKFIVWTGAALTKDSTTPENAERARQFFTWVRNSWDEKGDNIFVWDFWSLETEGGLYLKPAYAADASDSHPNAAFSTTVAPYIGRRIIDVIEGGGDSGTITGKP